MHVSSWSSMARVSVIGLLALVAWRQTLECPVMPNSSLEFWCLQLHPKDGRQHFVSFTVYFVNDVLDPFDSWIQGAWMQSWVQAGQDDWLPPPLVCADLAIIWSFEFKSSQFTDMYWYVLYRKSVCLTNHLLGLQLRVACTFELDPSVSRALDRYNMIQLARKEVGVWWHASSLCLFWSILSTSLFSVYLVFLIFSFELSCDCCHEKFCGCTWPQSVHERWRYFVHPAGSTVASTISARPALHGRGGQLGIGHQDDWKWSLNISYNLLHIQNYTKLYKHI